MIKLKMCVDLVFDKTEFPLPKIYFHYGAIKKAPKLVE